MLKRFLVNIFIFSLVLLFINPMPAQQTRIYHDPEAALNTGLDLIEKKQYGAAQHLFAKLAGQLPPENPGMLAEISYYDALCDYRLGHPSARQKLISFTTLYPENTHANLANIYLGFIEYDNRKYADAVKSFEKADAYGLGPEMKAEFLYKLGYSYLKTDEIQKAKEAFAPLLNLPSDYRNGANYYYAHIAYLEKNYDEALTHFETVKDDKEFGTVVPYYILQINYLNQNYDEVIRLGPSLLENRIRDKKANAEATRILAEAFFRKGRYAEAVQWFEACMKTSSAPLTREENYQFAFACHQSENWNKAIPFFQKTVNEKDQLSQQAYYYLGDCYLNTGQKQFAQNAFWSAFQPIFDKKVSEEALFSYAKLTIELSYDPYKQAINSLKNYIDNNPGGNRTDEAIGLLTSLFLATRDYQAAMDAIENSKSKNTHLKSTYQKVSYLRGIQLFNAGDFTGAATAFRKSLTMNTDSQLTTDTKFWLAESWYQSANYPKAIDQYDDFLLSPGASALDEYPLALYSLGYAHFKLEFYDNATEIFRKFLTYPSEANRRYLTDAMIRIGDCYFIGNDYRQAIDFYDKAIRQNAAESDYALYQKALAEGATGKYQSKTGTLRQLIERYPRSSYTDDACFELGQTYLLTPNDEEALAAFGRIVSEYPKSGYYQKALLKTGMIHYNNNNNDQALLILRQVVTGFPGSDAAREALTTIRNIYMDKNDPDQYYAFVQSVPGVTVTATEQDSITYLVAENLYMNNDCDSASMAFGNYLRKFPGGAFVVPANFYLAECLFTDKQYDLALPAYEAVIAAPKSKHTEISLLHAAEIHFANEKYHEALEHYKNLELNADYPSNLVKAFQGQMECNFRTGAYRDAISAATHLLESDKLTSQQMTRAVYVAGKSSFLTDSLASAQKYLAETTGLSSGPEGAEAKYLLAEICFRQKKYTEAEEHVFGLAGDYPSEEYWKAKGFILLADVYVAMGNTFQAVQTLKSVAENYEGAELREVASQKLAGLEETLKSGNENENPENH